jgi:nicotinamidase-related amidase
MKTALMLIDLEESYRNRVCYYDPSKSQLQSSKFSDVSDLLSISQKNKWDLVVVTFETTDLIKEICEHPSFKGVEPFRKKLFSAFTEIDIQRYLLEHGTQRLIIGGCLLGACVAETSRDAHWIGYQVESAVPILYTTSDAMHLEGYKEYYKTCTMHFSKIHKSIDDLAR